MKKKVGIITSSVAAIAVCSSLIAGSTFALFTSESEVNISVSAGNVEVVAAVGDLTATTSLTPDYSSTGENEVTFQNGGKASVENGALILENITPGDSLSFPVTVENKSTVDVKTSLTYSVTSGYLLASGLSVTVDGEEVTGKQEYSAGWTDLKEVYNVTVSLPEKGEIDNLYKGLSTDITFAVKAVQGNAAASAQAASVDLPDFSALKAAYLDGAKVAKLDKEDNFFDALKDSDVIVLTEDFDASKNDNKPNAANNIVIQADKTVVLDGHKINTDVCYEIAGGAVVSVIGGEWNTSLNSSTTNQAFKVHGNAAGTTLNIDGVTVNSASYAVGINNYVWVDKNKDEEPVVNIKNSIINCEDAYGSAVGTSGTLGTNASGNNYHGDEYINQPIFAGGTVNVENTVITSNGAGVTFTVPVDLNLTNCVINSRMQSIVARGGNITVTGCTLNNHVDKAELTAMINDGHNGFKYINTKYELGADAVASNIWNQANDVDLAAIVVGNNVSETTNSYKYPATVTVTDTVFNTSGDITQKVVVSGYRDNATFNYSYSADFAGEKLTAADIAINGEHTQVNG